MLEQFRPNPMERLRKQGAFSGAVHVSALAVLGLTGCNLIFGIQDGTLEGTGAGGDDGTTTTATAGGGTGDGGGSGTCTPTEQVPCYEGAAGTEGKGACVGGLKTCLSSGMGFGSCMGQVLPQAGDDCDANVDTSCDDMLTCACTPNMSQACYDGAPGTDANPPCQGGTRVCNAQGTGYGVCAGQQLPEAQENCTTAGVDDDCDGVQDEFCTCTAGETRSCYTGIPPASEGVGECQAGQQVCNMNGTGFNNCAGEVVPQAEDFNDPGDENCDGRPTADLLWSDILIASGSNDTPMVQDIELDGAGNIFIAGYDSDAGKNFVEKWDPSNGAVVWHKEWTLYSNSRLTLDSNGNVYVTGNFSGTLSIDGSNMVSNGTNDDVYLASWTNDGVVRFVKRYGGTGNEYPSAIAANNLGYVVIGGSFHGTFEFDGSAPDITAVGTGTIYDAFLFGVQSNGNDTWAVRYGDPTSGATPATQSITTIAIDSGNHIVMAGDFFGTMRFGTTNHISNGGADVFVARVDAFGATLDFSRAVGGPGNDHAGAVTTDPAGNVIAVGAAASAVDLGGGTLPFAGVTDGVAVKMTPLGAHIWSMSAGGNGYDSANAVVTDGQGNVYIASEVSESIDVGNGPISISNGVLLAALRPDKTHLWSKIFDGTPSQYNPILGRGPSMFSKIALSFFNSGAIDLGFGLHDSGGIDSSVTTLIWP